MSVYNESVPRNDFTGYKGLSTVEQRAHWQFELTEGDALPFSGDLAGFTAKLNAFSGNFSPPPGLSLRTWSAIHDPAPESTLALHHDRYGLRLLARNAIRAR